MGLLDRARARKSVKASRASEDGGASALSDWDSPSFDWGDNSSSSTSSNFDWYGDSDTTPAAPSTPAAPAAPEEKKETGPAWQSVAGHASAYDHAEDFGRSWMAGPAHRDAYQHAIWSPPKEGERFPSPDSRQVYDRITPSTDKQGRRGVIAGRGMFNDFIPNEEIGSMAYFEREGAEPSWKRQERYDASRPSYRNDID